MKSLWERTNIQSLSGSCSLSQEFAANSLLIVHEQILTLFQSLHYIAYLLLFCYSMLFFFYFPSIPYYFFPLPPCLLS